MPSRRACLAALSSGIAVAAGCVSGGSDGDDAPDSNRSDGSPQDDEADANESDADGGSPGEDESAAELRDVTVGKAVPVYRWPASTEIVDPDREQFVVATVSTEREISASDFVLETESERYAPDYPVPNTSQQITIDGLRGFHPSIGVSPVLLVFRLPSPHASTEYEIRYEGDTAQAWELSTDLVDRLTSPQPSFDLVAFDCPSTIDNADEFDVGIEARNESYTDGRFLAAVTFPTAEHDDDEAHVVSEEVAGGDRLETTLQLDGIALACNHEPGESESVPLTLGGCVEADREIRVHQTETFVEKYCD